jgi:predicted nicotinamide N-methyase
MTQQGDVFDVFAASELLAAMAPQETVLAAFARQQVLKTDAPDEEPEWHLQEQFAKMVASHWRGEFSPSKRYLAHLVQLFVRQYDERELQSESLMELYLDMASKGANPAPDPKLSCYCTFPVPRDGSLPLRVPIFPYHNDVSLRFWEAGAALAEYLKEKPEWVKGKRVIELGAGVGVTGLVAAALCDAEHVLCTDCSELALSNMRRAWEINREWLESHRSDGPSRIGEAYLDWDDYGAEEAPEIPRADLPIALAMEAGDILLAADVAYDRSVIPSLVRTVHRFLQPGRKVAIFATTRRNLETFRLLKDEIHSHGISSRVIATGHDCERLEMLFPKKFHQARKDVEIWALEL